MLLVEEPGEIFFSSLARTVQPDTAKDNVQHLNKAYLTLGVYQQPHLQLRGLIKQKKERKPSARNKGEREVQKCVAVLQQVFKELERKAKEQQQRNSRGHHTDTLDFSLLPKHLPPSFFSDRSCSKELPPHFAYSVNLLRPDHQINPPTDRSKKRSTPNNTQSDLDSDWTEPPTPKQTPSPRKKRRTKKGSQKVDLQKRGSKSPKASNCGTATQERQEETASDSS